MPPLALLIKPASGMCNMNCTYCFYHDLMSKREIPSYGFMSGEVREALVRKALDYADGQCTFGFQGGEPTLAGLDFYREFVDLAQRCNHKRVKLTYFIQTNGYHLTEEWAKFLAENHFLTGISLDGTIHTHNRYRKDYEGQGTFARVMDSIELLDKFNVEYNILTVVNQATAMNARKIYQFCHKHDFRYLQFIPCLDPEGAVKGGEPYSLLPEAYGQFLCQMFDLWYDGYLHGDMVSIRNFDNYLGMLKGYPPEACDMRGICSVQHVVEADGSVYPCDFYVLDRWRLGNVLEGNFGEFAESATAGDFIAASETLHGDCGKCSYFGLCRGGCRRLREETDSGRNYFCRSYRQFFDYALERMAGMR